MTTYDVLDVISDVRLEEFSKRSFIPLTSEKFYYYSHARWALDELEDYIWKHQDCKDVVYLLETYRKKMDDWSCLPNKSTETCRMYAIAYDIVTYVIEQVIIINQAVGEQYQEWQEKVKE